MNQLRIENLFVMSSGLKKWSILMLIAVSGCGGGSADQAYTKIAQKNAGTSMVPEAPKQLMVSTADMGKVQITWQTGDSKVAVSTYRIYLSGAMVGQVSGNETRYTNQAMLDDRELQYQVAACNDAGACSALSSAVIARVLNSTSDGSDTFAPSNPALLRIDASKSGSRHRDEKRIANPVYQANTSNVLNIGNSSNTESDLTSISIIWNASTDNVGVASYEIWRDGSKVQSVAAPSVEYSDKTLKKNKEYRFFVRAVDVAGNVSGPSNEIQIKPILSNISNNALSIK